jgi:hypothetical protein
MNMAVSHTTVRLRCVVALIAVAMLPISSPAGADDSMEKLRELIAAAREEKAQVEMVRWPKLVDALRLTTRQSKKIRRVLHDMNEEFARKEGEIKREAIDSDVEGPYYAAMKVPELSRIARHARGEICFEILSEDQYRVLRAAWDEAEKKRDEADEKDKKN